MTFPLAVTVTAKQTGRYLAQAREKAREWGLPFLERPQGSPLAETIATVADALLVLSGEGWKLHDAHGSLHFSPGMAAVRVKRPREEDALVRLCELKAGDSVLDCTLGLASDALVCARAVGPSGRVIGVEASLPLYALASEGLKTPPFEDSAAIEVRHGCALAAMQELESHSVDCVIFDPMFDLPKGSSPSFGILRRYALHDALDEPTLEEARRVARRWVVVKGGRYGKELTRLGLTAIKLSRFKPLVWARVEPRNALSPTLSPEGERGTGASQGMSAARLAPLGRPSLPSEARRKLLALSCGISSRWLRK